MRPRRLKTPSREQSASDKTSVDAALIRLFRHFRDRRHPLAYQSRYQLLIMVILSAQDSDRHINKVAPEFFNAFPKLSALVNAKFEDLMPLLKSVRNFGNKIKWILEIARTLGSEEQIPHSMEALIELPGIGRKSAGVILRESGDPAEGIIVDLHVVRVAPRLGLTTSARPDRMESDLMSRVPRKYWNDAGMAISFLGREICRPKDPKCPECLMNIVCPYDGKTLTPPSTNEQVTTVRKKQKRGAPRSSRT